MEKSVVFNNKLLPYLLLVPQLIITFVFFYWPASQAVWQSFPARGRVRTELRIRRPGELPGVVSPQPEYYKAILTTLVFSSLGRGPCRSRSHCCSQPRPTRTLKAAGRLQDADDLALCGWRPAVAGVLWIFMFHPFAGHAGATAALDELRLESAF